MKPTFLILLFLSSFQNILATDNFKVHTDNFYSEGKYIFLDIFVLSDKADSVSIQINSQYKHKNEFQRNNIVSYTSTKIFLLQGMNKIKLKISDVNKDSIDSSIFKPLSKLGILPQGEYSISLRILGKQDTMTSTFLRYTKPEIKSNTKLYEVITLASKKAERRSKGSVERNAAYLTNLNHELAKFNLSAEEDLIDNKYVLNISDGRYDLGVFKSLSLKEKAKKELQNNEERTRNSINQKADKGLEYYESIFSQLKTSKSESKQEAYGYISARSNFGNQQEAFSGQKKNFYELEGALDIPIFGIPVSVSGFYTTQDIGRSIKSSFIHFQYDANKAKEKMMNLITNYKSEYEIVESKGKGLQGTYQSFLGSLESQKVALGQKLFAKVTKSEYASIITENPSSSQGFSLDTTLLLTLVMNKIDSLESVNQGQEVLANSKDSLMKVYQSITKKYNEYLQIKEKYEKYQSLVNQYKNTTYFDSILAYKQLKDIKNVDDVSYKDLAKSASALLPEGKVKKITTGITSMNVGVFSKYNSKYTLGGQQIKGLDIGYDLGFAEVSLTTGKTEYIGRSGDIDRYSFYTGSLRWKPILKQRFELIYYGYSPSRRMLDENKEFFKNINTTLPSFQNPGHLIAFKQDGFIFKRLLAESEFAYSFKSGGNENNKFNDFDNLAYSFNIQGDIPRTTISFSSSYEHIGKRFENNTLPFSASGTNRLKISTNGAFFRNRVELGLDYNLLIQQNISNLSRNTRWGIDFKYKSKVYPSVSLSYKPFTTFRSFTDTLFVPQRPLLGEVWTGKINYQYKKGPQLVRLLLLYNKSMSKLDTSEFKNELLQLSIQYINKVSMTSLSISRTELKSTAISEVPAWHAQNRAMFAVSESYSLNNRTQANCSLEFGYGRYGLSSFGGMFGLAYTALKRPVTYRISSRFVKYRLDEEAAWQNVIRGNLEMIWRFKLDMTKAKEKY